MLRIQRFVFNPFEENTMVVADETGQAVIIDPGCYEPEEQRELEDFITAEGLTIKYVLNTHCHIDHVLGNYHATLKYHVPLLIHTKEVSVLQAVISYASNYGFPGYQETTADQFLDEGAIVNFGNTKLETLFIPGHSPGHIGFYCKEEKILFGGDVLFNRSIGRTDLPGGNYDTLIRTIHQKLFTLPEEVIVYPGHGPTTTIGEEKISNPFCALSLLKG